MVPGRYRDSGMMGTAANERPECFWRADLLEAAIHLVATIRRTRPQVVVTYDDFGQYGHPDHIQAHRVTSYALVLAAAPSFRPDLGDAVGGRQALLDRAAEGSRQDAGSMPSSRRAVRGSSASPRARTCPGRSTTLWSRPRSPHSTRSRTRWLPSGPT